MKSHGTCKHRKRFTNDSLYLGLACYVVVCYVGVVSSDVITIIINSVSVHLIHRRKRKQFPQATVRSKIVRNYVAVIHDSITALKGT